MFSSRLTPTSQFPHVLFLYYLYVDTSWIWSCLEEIGTSKTDCSSTFASTESLVRVLQLSSSKGVASEPKNERGILLKVGLTLGKTALSRVIPFQSGHFHA